MKNTIRPIAKKQFVSPEMEALFLSPSPAKKMTINDMRIQRLHSFFMAPLVFYTPIYIHTLGNWESVYFILLIKGIQAYSQTNDFMPWPDYEFYQVLRLHGQQQQRIIDTLVALDLIKIQNKTDALKFEFIFDDQKFDMLCQKNELEKSLYPGDFEIRGRTICTILQMGGLLYAPLLYLAVLDRANFIGSDAIKISDSALMCETGLSQEEVTSAQANLIKIGAIKMHALNAELNWVQLNHPMIRDSNFFMLCIKEVTKLLKTNPSIPFTCAA